MPADPADLDAIGRACAEQARRATDGTDDIAAYCAAQVGDADHREVIGPQLPGAGPSGVVVLDGSRVAEWGDPTRPEMAFSATKSIASLVAGLAFDDGLLGLDTRVREAVDLPQFTAAPSDRITWRHLLEQTSGWDGWLWGKPASVDAQSRRRGSAAAGTPPGEGWAYNDVRVNLLCLALTALLRRPLPEVLAERVMAPIGASHNWTWHGYRNSTLPLDGRGLPVVSGGAHWGGGLWISASDLALVGELYRRRGRWDGRQVISSTWIDLSWTPSTANPEYGLLWWLNDHRTVFPTAPATGRAARGNLGRHLLWVDPARDLVIVSRWGEQVETLLRAVSECVPVPR
ncbi:serine hydrolase domain-containing protein [Pseudonocardia sichuanensis]|uniref:CubicO group peptidase (Beta-lactamase class C family) n=1 Tax=Pseudonocardia kunmingensis TaxID=630975 RepID=A0A543DQY0_9PSEU|nr:serine hydrolase [Pseudonocardia kunmingensis]TQM11737.1 CubicO group peptidase (beta-lactamase class C family) [Pseudonocardia kunmingensis]